MVHFWVYRAPHAILARTLPPLKTLLAIYCLHFFYETFELLLLLL